MMARLEAEEEAQEAEWRQQRLQVVGPLADRAAREMEIEATRYERDLVIFEGRLRSDAEPAYERLGRGFAELNRAPRLLEGEDSRTLIVAVPVLPEEAKPVPQNLTVPLLLFAATLVTTTWAGALHQGVDIWQEPARFAVGLPYSLTLMAILLVHELGHYMAGRIHGIRVSLPYFIPVPMGLGTFGAFIQIRGAIPDRRKLFDVGVAGPLAGLVIALPALYFGLQGTVATPSGPGVSLSSSVLLTWLYALANGGPVRPDHMLALTPLGFAGWLGLLVTALNLIPVGQLDGGHIAYALVGRRRAETLGWVAFFLLLALGIFYWSGWLTWAILIFFLGGVKHEPALNELPVPGWQRRAIGALAFVLLFLIMAPVPHRFMTALGILCPYV
jgi:membrane-associated protease RseP (regulator of RpoE activity)